MEDHRGDIEDLMQRYGYAEKEAQAAYHLNRARSLIGEMYRDEAAAEAEVEAAFGNAIFARIYAQVFMMSSVLPHFDALESLLAKKVLARQYPEGWGTTRR